MKRILSFISGNILYLCTLLLLLFIPLYPKIPLLDVRNTWVYVRVEDFLVIAVLAVWCFLLFKRRVTLKTPLTIPIIIFWIIGVVATIHGVILIFPQISNVFPNVALLSYLRHIEYMSLFFVAYSGIKDKKQLQGIIAILCITFVLVCLYGVGQKFLGFPAYLTMNEEFAKGLPIRLSQLSRVPSTFAGHYDLAAYLVLMIPILASLFFGIKNWAVKIFLLGSIGLGIILLSMTVSRVSFLVLFIALFIVLFFQKKKMALIAIPLVLILGLFFLSSQSALFSRFGNTIKEVNVLVDAQTGNAIGHINYVPFKNFEGKTISQRKIGEGGRIYTSPVDLSVDSKASPSSLLLFKTPPAEVPAVSDVNLSTGENLPQGTGYINLSLSPVEQKLKYFFYEKTKDADSSDPSQVFIFHGDFLVKRATAYDLSFTTRFQGEWPNALLAFNRNIFIGSGYGSVSLAVDNNYLRMLGETGLLGFLSFLVIFLALGIYIKKVFPDIDSKLTKSFILGFVAGLIGLSLNAFLIDVFEASKIAFLLWMLVGIIFGILVLYQRDKINLQLELKKVATSSYAVIVYLFTFAFFIYSPMLNNFFVGDDFTWLRWVVQCPGLSHSDQCLSLETIANYFTNSNGFFYRPGTKTYFLLMHSLFWFNQVVYHAVSLILHFTVVALFFQISRKVFRNFSLSVLASFLFLIVSGYSETVFWISSTGSLFNAVFALSAILSFIKWYDTKKSIYFILSLIFSFAALLFHEIGVVIPLFMLLYKFYKEDRISIKNFSYKYIFLFVPGIVYLLLRLSAQSHWFSGDYSYNLMKLPFNVVGNSLGYMFLTFFGSISLPLYETLRNYLRENITVSLVLIVIIVIAGAFIRNIAADKLEQTERKIVVFSLSFFFISLIPFLGLGNITPRYSYLASLGLILVLAVLTKKLYISLQTYGREIAVSGVVLIIAVFSLVHLIQIQQINLDWNGAGQKSQNFFKSIEALYSNNWSKDPVELHFVNVPIRSGDAWVFPVGLSDAVWFAFKNTNIKIFKHSTKEEAFIQGADASAFNPVFVFRDDGSLEQVYHPKEVTPSASP